MSKAIQHVSTCLRWDSSNNKEKLGKNPNVELKWGKRFQNPKSILQNECKGRNELCLTIFKLKEEKNLALKGLGANQEVHNGSDAWKKGYLELWRHEEGDGSGHPGRWSSGRQWQWGGSEGKRREWETERIENERKKWIGWASWVIIGLVLCLITIEYGSTEDG